MCACRRARLVRGVLLTREAERHLNDADADDADSRELLPAGAEPDEPLLDVTETPSAAVPLNAGAQFRSTPNLNPAARATSSSSSRGCVSIASPEPAVGECVLPLRDGRTLALARRPDAAVALVRFAELGARALRSAHAPAYHLYQLLRAHSGALPAASSLLHTRRRGVDDGLELVVSSIARCFTSRYGYMRGGGRVRPAAGERRPRLQYRALETVCLLV